MYINKINLSEIIQKIKKDENYIFDLIIQICDLADKTEPFVKALLPEKNRIQRLMSDAKNLIQKYPDKEKRPVLFGIPVGIKDLFSVDGFVTKCGSELPAYLFESKEAETVKLLKNAGALIFGKTVTTEFAFFEPNETRNPYNIEHTPGGSSSGSAAAVACGIIPISLGTQTIGSITRPASFCGIFGYKPSFERISTEGVIPFSPSADHIGVFAQDIDSLKLTASILCKNWNKIIKYSDKEITIGVLTGKYIKQADNEVINFYNDKISDFEQKGLKIKRVDLFEDIDEINKIHRTMISSDFALVHQNWFSEYKNLYRQGTIDLIVEGKKHTIEELIEARLQRIVYRNKIEEIKSDLGIDLWLSPSTLSTAPKGMATGSPLMNLPWTFTGLPTITFPAGLSNGKMPFGLQFAGSFENDEELFNFVEIIKTFI
jgi:Asp-tRNA(Asn)/Glu-tRNA(Gln) amidotransferase A subunit family amidase